MLQQTILNNTTNEVKGIAIATKLNKRDILKSYFYHALVCCHEDSVVRGMILLNGLIAQ